MAKSVNITGRNQVVKRVKAVMAAMEDNQREATRGTVMTALGDAADVLSGAMKTLARLNGYPNAVIESIFSFRRLPPSLRARKKPSALAGVAKADTMREWKATAAPKSARAKVPAGGRVAMSLAAMYEFGTSKLAGRGAIGTAVTNSRAAVRETIVIGLQKIIRENSQS